MCIQNLFKFYSVILTSTVCLFQHFDDKCTHIVCKKPSKSEKFLGGCATGETRIIDLKLNCTVHKLKLRI